MAENTTVINDPIHGHIELDPLYMKIIDTPEFQRLRFLKQLGSTFFVFPGAHHTRFEHSIGVCYLAETLCKTLMEKQPELGITADDVKCVAIAGLCHDLGHGPFSHLFDGMFLSKLNVEWKHEMGSVLMFDYMLRANGLEVLFSERDLTFIREQIYPDVYKKDEGWPYKGRSQEKSFLYEVVANKRNGIDVDKWDYIARDCYYLGIRTAFDHDRLMKFVRVLDVEGENQICTRAKEVDSLYEMFHSRMCLYRQAYFHKTSLVIDYMICRALEEANEHLQLKGLNGQDLKMSESISHMPAFVQLTDNVFHTILSSTDSNMASSRSWLERILKRKLPKIIGKFKFDEGRECSEGEIMQRLFSASVQEGGKLSSEDIIVIKRKFDYGMGMNNPMDLCWFYNKHDVTVPYQVRKEQVSSFLPSKFVETQFLFFVNGDNEEIVTSALACYERVCREYGLDISMGAEQSCMLMTPLKPCKHNLKTFRSSEKKSSKKISFET